MSRWNGKYKSIKYIIEKVYRDTGAIMPLDINDAIEWAGECIEFIGGVFTLKDKYDCITIKDYKGKLPCDLYLLLGVREAESQYALRYTTDTFHHALVNMDINIQASGSDLTFSINDDYMFTSFQEGEVQLSYKAIPTDDDGYPLIPDDIKFVKAVEYYITERLYFRALGQGRIQQYLHEKVSLERDWYMAAAQNRRNLLSIDSMESLKNNWIRLIPKINQHFDNFRFAGEGERRKLNNAKWGGDGRGSDNDTYTYTG